jgi:hypothetical protein
MDFKFTANESGRLKVEKDQFEILLELLGFIYDVE